MTATDFLFFGCPAPPLIFLARPARSETKKFE